MKETKHQKDIALDVPAEANREKHVNFLEQEEESDDKEDARDDETSMKNRKLPEKQERGHNTG